MTSPVHFDLHGPCFLDASRDLVPTRPALWGVPYDGTTSFRPGTRFGPGALRLASMGLETYSPDLDADLNDLGFSDLGDLEVPFGAPEPVLERVRACASWLFEQGVKPLMLGGEHSLTPGAVQAACAVYPDLVVVQLDAHADLRQTYLDSPNSHACAMRRVLDHTQDLLQVGIRSGTRQEWEELRASGRLVVPDAQALTKALERFGQRPIYVTLDLDVLDPAALPGTGTPEPGGINARGLLELLYTLRGKNIVAADVMELAPGLDPTGCSAVVAAKAVRELMLLM